MRRSLAPFLVGLFVGVSMSSVTAQRVGRWYSGAELMDRSMHGYGGDQVKRNIRIGYASGVADAMAILQLAAANNLGSLHNVAQDLVKQAQCLDDRSGGNLEQFVNFAETIWQGRNVNAAASLLFFACQ